MRDLMLLGAMMMIVPLALSNAFAAYLVWGWTSVITVPAYLYGFMGSLRYNLLFALITLMLVLMGRAAGKGPVQFTRGSIFIILLILHGGICAALASPAAYNSFSIYTDLVKSLVFCLMMLVFVNSRLRMHAMLVAIALGLGFHGGVEGLKTIASGGGHKIVGLAGSKMADNNQFGVAIVMVLPILLYLYQYSKQRFVRLGFLGLGALTLVAIVGSASRGAFVATAVVAFAMILTGRRKGMALLAVVVGLGLVVLLGTDAWFERMGSIGEAGSDSSFMNRVEAWNIATALALRSPLVGMGFHAAQVPDVWFSVRPADGLLSAYVPPIPAVGGLAAHSIFFEVLGDMGFIGLGIFVLIMFNAFATARAIKSMAKKKGPALLWAYDMADALRLACMAFAIGGLAVSLAYFETYYVIVMLLEMLRLIVKAELAAPATKPG
jgi:probable O-glycosylation ligase (exosortase A-associated)